MKCRISVKGRSFQSKMLTPTIKDISIYLVTTQSFIVFLEYRNFVSIRIIKL